MVKNLLIETKRLIIRPYNANDLEPSYRLMQDKELYQFLEFDDSMFFPMRNIKAFFNS